MPFIKAQKLRYDEEGRISSGSASIIDTVYVQTGRRDHSLTKCTQTAKKSGSV